MTIPRIAILTLILGILQVTILDYFKIFGVKPDLILIAVCFAALFLEIRPALVISLFAGLFKDMFLLKVLGFNIFLFPILVIIITKLVKRVSIEDDLSRISLVFVISLLNNILNGIMLAYSVGYLPLGIFLRITVVASLYTVLIFSLILRVTVK